MSLRIRFSFVNVYSERSVTGGQSTRSYVVSLESISNVPRSFIADLVVVKRQLGERLRKVKSREASEGEKRYLILLENTSEVFRASWTNVVEL